jgi:hypothetical protein
MSPAVALLVALAAAPASSAESGADSGDPAAAGSPAAVPETFVASGLSFARCALGRTEDCLRDLKCGLLPEDRDSVRLSPSGEVLVDDAHASRSENFAVLKRLAGSGERTRILVLAPTDFFSLRASITYPDVKLSVLSSPMGHPDSGDGFLGYTFFQFRGRLESGILYSSGESTDVVINARQTGAAIAVALHHEFRHVAAGDFGRAATLAMHGLPAMESSVASAEAEALENAALCP